MSEDWDPAMTDWDRAMCVIHSINGDSCDAELAYAKEWADVVEVDYDDGPCAIRFKKGDLNYWFLIDDMACDWDADDPCGEMLLSLLAERDSALADRSRLQSTLDGLLEDAQRGRAIRGQRDATMEAEHARREADLARWTSGELISAKATAHIADVYEAKTAEAIATWLEAPCPCNFADCASKYSDLASAVRAGDWRSKP